METLFALLYDLFIAPLAIAYGAAYSLCSRALGYGYGLLALSILTTLLLLPLRKKVAAAQDGERRLRRVIDPQLARIRAESVGEERHSRVRRLYRRYGYHPVMSIRAVWGLLLQVPFIFAAYHMLSELSALRLVSFWGIACLAEPDRLLPGGVNILPLLMTAFNIAAALLTPEASGKETARAFVIAGLFLVLLYGAPSALLIYWTANNFLSLVETLRERRLRGRGTGAPDIVEEISPPLGGSAGGTGAGTHGMPTAWLTLYAFALATLPVAWGFALRRHVEEMLSGESPYYFSFSWVELLLAGLAIAAAALGAKRVLAGRAAGLRAGVWAVVRIVLCSGLAVFILYGWAASMRLRTVSGKLFIWSTLICVMGGVLAWFTAAGGLTGGLWRLFKKEADRSGAALYWPAALALAGLLVFFAPMALYQSAPEAFNRSAGSVARELLPYFLCIVYVFLYLKTALSRGGAAKLGLLAAYFALAGLILSLAFPPNGILDGDAFLPDRRGGEWLGMAQDVLTLAAVLACLFVMAHRNVLCRSAQGLGGCAAAMAVFGLYVAVSMPGAEAGNAAAAAERSDGNVGGDAKLPPVHKRLFALSPDRPNILVFMYDQYHGGDIGRMLDEDPEMASRLPGFVWHRDVVSDGNNTLMSFPALLGGPGYTPGAINLRRGQGSLADRVVAATAELPRRFLNAGYAVCCYNVRNNLAVDNGTPLSGLVGYSGDRLVDVPAQPEYAGLAWKEIASAGGAAGTEDGGDAKLLLTVSLFRSVPNFLRAGLIDLSVFATESFGKIPTDIAIPLLMPRFLTADSEEPTYKIFVSTLSHNPFLLGPDSLMPLAGEERRALSKSADAHFYTERHIIRLLEALVARLKALGVYGNTRIILASDHDYQRDSNPFLRNVTSLFEQLPPRPHALLLVKDFNADGPLAVSDRLMQGHDMPALACAGLPDIADAPALPPDDPVRERRHYVGRANLLHHPGDSFSRLRILVNRGSMFEPANWEQIEQAEGNL